MSKADVLLDSRPPIVIEVPIPLRWVEDLLIPASEGLDRGVARRGKKAALHVVKAQRLAKDVYLRRMMQKNFRHGKTVVDTHIKLDSGCYDWFLHGGRGWIEVMSLEPRKRLAIPLASNQPISGTIRLIVKAREVEVRHTIEAPEGEPCGEKTIGVDKGYTEVFVDSDGDKHGIGLGKVLSTKTDANSPKYRRRNKIEAIAERVGAAKRERILKNNLGRQKLDRQKKLHKQNVRSICYNAAHSVVDKAKIVAAEDLMAVIGTHDVKRADGTKRIRGPQEKRRLSAWVKGLIAEALENVSRRRGSTVRLVNSAYSSQVHSRCRCLARRDGDVLHCDVCGDDVPSDREAAREILARLHDHEIGRWTSHQKVKSILQERSSRYRLGLFNQDSSCADSASCDAAASTESEKPDSSHEQL